ncbi:MAG: hypothetical protein ACRDK2_06150, partial [Solirubrobacteraceae bacterium]
MQVAAKLQLKPSSTVAVMGIPHNIELELPDNALNTVEAASADAVIAFAIHSTALDSVVAAAIAAAREDRLAWIAYPKAGKLNTDLNRDALARLAQEHGVQP